MGRGGGVFIQNNNVSKRFYWLHPSFNLKVKWKLIQIQLTDWILAPDVLTWKNSHCLDKKNSTEILFVI